MHRPIVAATTEGDLGIPDPADPNDPRNAQNPLYWIIGLLTVIILVLIWVIATDDDGDVALAPSPVPTATLVETPPAVTTPPTVDVVPADPLEPTPTPTPTALADPTTPPTPPEPAEPTPAPAPPPPEPEPAPPQPPPAGERPPEDPGEVMTADGRSLFPVDEAALPTFVDSDVSGREVLVQSVVDGVGFWIGTGEDNRVFVQNDPGVLGLAGYTPAPGERVNFSGTVVANQDEQLVPDDQGGEQYRRQGVHLELVDFQPAG